MLRSMYIWISSCIFLMPNRVKSAERQIKIWRAVRTCHSEPVRTLVWESPSNFGQPIVIQTALFVPLSGIFPREVVLLIRRLPRQFENWLAMTGKSAARQIPICRATERYRAGQGGNEYRSRSSRLGRPPCGQIPISLSASFIRKHFLLSSTSATRKNSPR